MFLKLTFICLLMLTSLEAKDYVFAMYPSNNPAKIIQALTPLMNYLDEKSGDTFRLVVTKDYEELSQRIKEKSVDFAWINTKNYVQLKEQIPSLHYLVTYQEISKSGQITPYYQAFIVSLKDSQIRSLEQAKDKNFAFTDKDSTSGYAYPMMIFEDNHINPYTFFNKVFFLKKHDNVIESLVNHSIDMGAISDGTYYNGLAKYGDIFNVVATSLPIPLDVIIATDEISEHECQKITALLETIPLNAPSNQAFRKYLGWMSAGFTKKNEAFYDDFKHILYAHHQ